MERCFVRCSRVWAPPPEKENTVLLYGHNRQLYRRVCPLRVPLKRVRFPPGATIVIVRARGKPQQIGATRATRADDRVVDGKKYHSALLCEQLDSAKQRQSDDIAVFDMTNSLVAQRFVIISEQRFFEVLPEDSRMAVLTV